MILKRNSYPSLPENPKKKKKNCVIFTNPNFKRLDVQLQIVTLAVYHFHNTFARHIKLGQNA